ncbi:MAG: TIGR00730 family Rossman fold protein [Actinomycetales bacterium]|nr:TIGR00730 family Rossman fold protein [Actinomycetales bacterium]
MAAVCVFCASSLTIDDRYLELAARTGEAIARRGWGLVSGAGSISMMGALGRAARAAGGHTVGVIPDALVALEVADHESDEFIITRDMRQRKGVMDERSDAFLALPGGIGTLEELIEVWTARSLNMHHKPVVVLDPWGDYQHLHALLDHWMQRGFVKEAAVAHVHWAVDVDDALDEIARAWQEADGHGGMTP